MHGPRKISYPLHDDIEDASFLVGSHEPAWGYLSRHGINDNEVGSPNDIDPKAIGERYVRSRVGYRDVEGRTADASTVSALARGERERHRSQDAISSRHGSPLRAHDELVRQPQLGDRWSPVAAG
jgi:hypothetical protein